MKRKVVVCGKNDIGVRCLESILRHGDDVIAAYASPHDTGKDGWQRSLRKAAEERGIPVYAPRNINAPAEVERLRALNPDFLFSFQYERILKEPVIRAPSIATLNLHFALLPRHRGCAPIAWSIIMGDRETGATLHHIDPGIDTGALVAQASVPILPTDNGRTVYDKCVDAGVRMFAEQYPAISSGAIPFLPQDASRAVYHPKDELDFSKRTLDLGKTAREAFDWARAFIFPPFQYPELTQNGKTAELLWVGLEGLPEFSSAGAYRVPLQDGALLVYEARADGRQLSGVELSDYFRA